MQSFRYGWQNKNQKKTKNDKKNCVFNMKKNKISIITSIFHGFIYFMFLEKYNVLLCFSRALLSKESKDKLSVNFMYEPPPGAKKEREREDNEPEYKFEWQRKFNAPREE